MRRCLDCGAHPRGQSRKISVGEGGRRGRRGNAHLGLSGANAAEPLVAADGPPAPRHCNRSRGPPQNNTFGLEANGGLA